VNLALSLLSDLFNEPLLPGEELDDSDVAQDFRLSYLPGICGAQNVLLHLREFIRNPHVQWEECDDDR